MELSTDFASISFMPKSRAALENMKNGSYCALISLGLMSENNQSPISLRQRFRKLGAAMTIAYQAKTTQRFRSQRLCRQRLRRQRLRMQRLRKLWLRHRIRTIS